MRKSILLMALTCAMFLPLASAADIFVDTSWMQGNDPTLINNILDGNPGTLGKNGQVDAQTGDTVHFASGTYQLPFQQGVRFKLFVDGVTIQGAGWDSTIFRGPSPNSGIIWEVNAQNAVLKSFRTENSLVGLRVNDEDYEDIDFNWLKTKGHDKHYVWDEQQDDVETTAPAVVVENGYLIDGGIGFHYGEIDGAQRETKYFGGSHVTVDGVDAIGIDAPIVWEDNRVIEMKGNDDWTDTIIVNTEAPFVENAYEGMNSPSYFVEFRNNADSLFARGIGEGNLEADPMLDARGRPKPGSPAIGSQYKDGYAGAVPPRGPPSQLGDVMKKNAISAQKIPPGFLLSFII